MFRGLKKSIDKAGLFSYSVQWPLVFQRPCRRTKDCSPGFLVAGLQLKEKLLCSDCVGK